MRDVLNGQSRSQIRLRRMKSTCGGGNRLRDEILLRREKKDGFDFFQGGSLGFHLNEVKISSWLDTISSESRKRENRMDFHFVLSLLFIASFAFVLQMHRAAPIPLSYLSDKDITQERARTMHIWGIRQQPIRTKLSAISP